MTSLATGPCDSLHLQISMKTHARPICRSHVPSAAEGVAPAVYFLVFLACFTKFSMTPSNASRSLICSSVLCCQYSRTAFAVPSRPSNLATWAPSSSSVMPSSASSVVAQSCRAATISNSGGGGAPLRLLEDEDVVGPLPLPPPLLPPPSAPPDAGDLIFVGARDPDRRESDDVRGEFIEGRTSFFCLDAGKISSRSTGTPSETRNSRLMRERIQSGG